MSRNVYKVSQPDLLGIKIAQIQDAFLELEALRKKGKITKLPEALVTLGDLRDVVKYNSFRARIILCAANNVSVRVPFTLVRQIASDIESRTLCGTHIRVSPLGFWDHVLLWRIRMRSRVPISPEKTQQPKGGD